MLKINFEFRKGIFFIRLIGELKKETSKQVEKELTSLILDNQFKYVVINTNYLKSIDMDGLNYITKICYIIKEHQSDLIICDKLNIFKTLLNNNFPNISNELEVL